MYASLTIGSSERHIHTSLSLCLLTQYSITCITILGSNVKLYWNFFQVYQTIEKNEIRLEDQDRKDAIKIEWQQLALVIDRLLLVIFVVFTIAITLALILPGYYAQSKDIE